mmetsp:Transcript_15712/g.38244  ORF Transcript_15712/g.38244 Transcript_15712/m.38244 type:complete len:219 (+) Transcript_15712:207-863(+)
MPLVHLVEVDLLGTCLDVFVPVSELREDLPKRLPQRPRDVLQEAQLGLGLRERLVHVLHEGALEQVLAALARELRVELLHDPPPELVGDVGGHALGREVRRVEDRLHELLDLLGVRGVVGGPRCVLELLAPLLQLGHDSLVQRHIGGHDAVEDGRHHVLALLVVNVAQNIGRGALGQQLLAQPPVVTLENVGRRELHSKGVGGLDEEVRVHSGVVDVV